MLLGMDQFVSGPRIVDNIFHTCLYLHFSKNTLQLMEDPQRVLGPPKE